MLDSTLPFLLAGKYRRLELLALSIQSRAQQQLDRLDLARQVSGQILEVAELVKDEGQIAIAASNLASVMESLGQYPAALALRERAEQIHRRAEDRLVLPYDITNRAEVLIRLGRFREAETALSEVDAGIAAHVDTYVGRQPRVRFLRGLADAVNLRCDKVRDRFRDVNPASQTGSARALAPAIVSYCAARIDGPGSPVAAAVGATDRPAIAREVHYWAATAAFERKTYRDALAEARQGLDQLEGIPNDELRWRLAAVGALAADAARYNEGATDLERIGRTAWERMKSEWGVALAGYKVRPDVHELRQHVSRIWNDLGN